MIKKWMAFSLALVMSLGLVGCSTNQPATQPDSAQKPSQKTEETKKPEEPSYPTKPIQVVVPAKPGGDTDLTSRFNAKYMEQFLGQPIATVNMEGAHGSLAINDVTSSEPDGYKALYYHTDIITQKLLGNSDFDWKTDIEIAGIPFTTDDYSIFVRADAPFNNIKELTDYVKNPANKKLIAGGEKNSIAEVLAIAAFKKMGIDMKYVDSGGVATKIPALKGGQIDFITGPYSVIADYVKNGDFKVLGTYAAERNPAIPDVPTLKEQGVDVVYSKFFVYVFPKGTPKNVIDTFTNALQKTTESKDYAKDIGVYNAQPHYYNPEQAREFISQQQANLQEYFDMFKQSKGK